MWQQIMKVGPAVTGALVALLLMPGSLVWSVLALATVSIVAIRRAVPATAAVAAKRR